MEETTWGKIRARSEPRWFYCFMDKLQRKKDVLDRLLQSREVHTMEVTKNWKDAFKLYNEFNGVKLAAEDLCSKCYQRVLDWLQGEK